MLGTTFGGNYLACAAALAVLEVIENEKLIDNAAKLGGYLTDQLNGFSAIPHVRGHGLMLGFDLPEEKKSVRADLLMKHHIFTGEAKPNTIRLLPSLAVTKNELDIFLQALKQELE